MTSGDSQKNSSAGSDGFKSLTLALASIIVALVMSQTGGIMAATGIGIEIFVAFFASGAALGLLFAVLWRISERLEKLGA